MEKAYAQAVQSVLTKGTSETEVVTSLLAHLKSAGRLKLLPSILRELKALQAKTSTTVVEVASEKESAQALREASLEGIVANEAVVNPNLIRGWRARNGSVLTDRSAKRSLIELYRRIAS